MLFRGILVLTSDNRGPLVYTDDHNSDERKECPKDDHGQSGKTTSAYGTFWTNESSRIHEVWICGCSGVKKVEIPRPEEGEVLVRVYAASVNAADWRLLKADPFLVRLSQGFLKPRDQILGSNIAGRVEAVGGGVTQFRPGATKFMEIYLDVAGAVLPSTCALVKMRSY